MRTLIFLQARLGSTRLPGKVLFPLEGKSVIAVMVERLKRVRSADGTILVTGPAARNKALIAEAQKLGIPYFSGSEENLLDRYYKAIEKFKPDAIIRVTADCPLIDPSLIEDGLAMFKRGKYDLLTNARTHSFPHGLDYEIFSVTALRQLWRKRRSEFTSERVFQKTFINPTAGIPNLPKARVKDIAHTPNLGHMRWTLDYPADYILIKKIFHGLRSTPNFNWRDVLRFMKKHPELARINERHLERR